MYERMLCLDSTNNLPLGLITLHQLMRRNHILKLEHLLNKDLELPTPQLLQRILNNHIPQLPLIPLITTPQRTPFIPHPLPQEIRNIHGPLNLNTPQKRQIHNPPIQRRSLQIILEIPSPDIIHDNINPAPIRSLTQFPRPVLRAVIEPRRRAQLVHAKGDFLVRARGHVDCGCTGRLGELDPGDGDGRCAGVPENAVSGLEGPD